MLLIVGTIPDANFPVIKSECCISDTKIIFSTGKSMDIYRGTTALIGAAVKTSEFLKSKQPQAFLAGDIGKGNGSFKLFNEFNKKASTINVNTIIFHYVMPDVDWHNKILFSLQENPNNPTLIADAGFMYAAKMSGMSKYYDLFTPDAGELAFLADEKAPHPFYTRGFILQKESHSPELLERAFKHGNTAKNLIIKGETDRIVKGDKIISEISEPSIPAMESIGGTGDTVSGISAALIEYGYSISEASVIAAKANRLAGKLANVTCESQVIELINKIPEALKQMKINS